MEHLKDYFMLEQSNLATRVLLGKGMSIDMVCKIIKNYQRCCIRLKQDDKSSRFAFHTYMEMYMRKHPNKFKDYFPDFNN